jgi:hypothetical protein
LQTKISARANPRALVGAVAVGSTMTLILGGAYFAGSAARAADDATQLSRLAVTEVSANASEGARSPAAAPLPRTVAEIVSQQLAGPPKVHPAEPFRGQAAGREFDCLATAVYYEARGEGAAGQRAVAQVVLNRVRHPAFPKSVCGVVFQGAARRGCQFSFACNGAMKGRKEPGAWESARAVAAKALAGAVMDDVGNATHFHARRVAPGWSDLVRVATIGSHVFYRFGGRAARSVAYRGGGASETPQPVTAPVAHNAGYTVLGPTAGDVEAGLQLAGGPGQTATAATLEPVKLMAAPPAKAETTPDVSEPTPAPVMSPAAGSIPAAAS